MIENIKKLAPIIKIKNFPSREKVINDFEKFLSERKSKEKYKIINKTNQLLFYVKNPILAYKFNERYNNKIKANSSYSNSNCSLIFNNDTKKNNTSLNISHNYSYIKPKLYLQPKSRTIHKPLNKSVSVISEYERKHWAKIRDKACIIENDSPYMDSISKEFIEKKNNEKKWVVKKNFDVFVGKASSLNNYNVNEIKNYVQRTPSLQPILYNFRPKEKNKWISKADFQLY